MTPFSEHEKQFVARIPRMRTVRRLTQQELADAAGLTRRAVALIEVGRRGISLGEAAAICKALDVPLADMIAAEPLTLTIRTQVD